MRLCSAFRNDHSAAGLWRALTLTFLLVSTLAERLENGLDIETTQYGDCSHKAQEGDEISMHYRGTLPGGSVFDESYKRGEPLIFTLGVGQVIEGWDLGLLGICLGEERRLIIPPNVSSCLCH